MCNGNREKHFYLQVVSSLNETADSSLIQEGAGNGGRWQAPSALQNLPCVSTSSIAGRRNASDVLMGRGVHGLVGRGPQLDVLT